MYALLADQVNYPQAPIADLETQIQQNPDQKILITTAVISVHMWVLTALWLSMIFLFFSSVLIKLAFLAESDNIWYVQTMCIA